MTRKGRPTKFGKRMGSDGLPPELKAWLKKQAEKREITYTELRREIFEAYRQEVENAAKAK